MPTFALNFSRPGQPGRRAVLQLPAPRLRRLPRGPAGVARRRALHSPTRSRRWTRSGCSPTAASCRCSRSRSHDGERPYTVFDVSERLRERGWLVPAYTFPENRQDLAALRIVVRNGFSPRPRRPAHRRSRRHVAFLEKLPAPLPSGRAPRASTTSRPELFLCEFHRRFGGETHARSEWLRSRLRLPWRTAGERRRFLPVRGAELRQDPGDVHARGLLADEEATRDLAIRGAGRHEIEHFALGVVRSPTGTSPLVPSFVVGGAGVATVIPAGPRGGDLGEQQCALMASAPRVSRPPGEAVPLSGPPAAANASTFRTGAYTAWRGQPAAVEPPAGPPRARVVVPSEAGVLPRPCLT